MDGSFPQLFATSTGVKYIVADGAQITSGGLGNNADSDVPTTDITGASRHANYPTLGAYEVLATKVADFSSHINIYSSNSSLNILGAQNCQLKVYNLTGRVVANDIIRTNNYNSEIFANGLYIIAIQNGEKVVTKKLLIQ